MSDTPDSKLLLIFSIFQHKLDAVDSAYATLGTKTGILFGFASAAITFYLNALVTGYLLTCVPRWLYLFRLGVVLPMLVALVCLGMAMKTRPFDDSPHEDILLSNQPMYSKKGKPLYGGKRPIDASYEEVLVQVIFDMQGSYARNMQTHSAVLKWYKCSLILLFAGVIVMIVGIFIPN